MKFSYVALWNKGLNSCQSYKTVCSSLPTVYPQGLFCTVDYTVHRVEFEYGYMNG
jgi:hypothetical protein